MLTAFGFPALNKQPTGPVWQGEVAAPILGQIGNGDRLFETFRRHLARAVFVVMSLRLNCRKEARRKKQQSKGIVFNFAWSNVKEARMRQHPPTQHDMLEKVSFTNVLEWFQKPKSKQEFRGQQGPQHDPKKSQRLEGASADSFPSTNIITVTILWRRSRSFHHLYHVQLSNFVSNFFLRSMRLPIL
jgi:hypothetical protein